MGKIKKTLLGFGFLSSGFFIINGHAAALEWREESRALPSASQWKMQSMEEALTQSLGGASHKDLTPRTVVDSEPFHRENKDGKIFLSFHERKFLGDREVNKKIVTEEYEELKRPALWKRDEEQKLSRLIVQSYFIKNSVDVPFGEKISQTFSWVKVESTEEEKKQTRELEGVEYELHSTQEVWEVEPEVKIFVDRPREEWKKVYVAPPPAPQLAPCLQRHVRHGSDSSDECSIS